MTITSQTLPPSGKNGKIVRISGHQPLRHASERNALPPPETRRWVMRRKAQVVTAVRNGTLTFEEACERYHLSEEEFKGWISLFDHFGMHGLRATRMQEYRSTETV
ncbi:MAG: DUF1153 domain-containing protein [Bdellovibrionales bacterium]